MWRCASPAAAFAALLCAAMPAGAQSDPQLRIRATRRDTITAGATVTAAFAVSSQEDDSARVMPHVEAPPDWATLTGAAQLSLPPRSAELLMLSVAVPARARAGVYSIRVWITTPRNPRGVADSVHVRVPERRGLDVTLTERPIFVVSGKSYDAGFLVRNRGNIASNVRLSVRSTLGAATLADTLVRLESEESRVVRATVRTRAGLESAADDVLEIRATHVDSSASPMDASARVTIIPEPSRQIEEYLKVPTQVRLRAASSDGVSPFEIYGRGPVMEGSATQMDFVFRGPTGQYSAFGERDEYRVDLTAPSWRARAGDHLFMLSPLTGGAQPGVGAGADMTRGLLSFGGYGQHFRRSFEKGNEGGVFLQANPRPDASVAVNVVDRSGGVLAGQVGSALVSLRRAGHEAEVELARSRGTSGNGLARSARMSGSSSGVTYDMAHVFGDTAFAGTQRAAEHDYLTASTNVWDALAFTVNLGTHRTDLSRSAGVPYTERFDAGTVAATLMDRVMLELGSVARATTVQGIRRKDEQRGVRVHADQRTPIGLLSLETEVGRGDAADSSSRVYTHYSIGMRRVLNRGAFAVWSERYSGGSITKGLDGTDTFGGDASLRLRGTTNLVFMGYATRLRVPGSAWNSQLDAQLSHQLPNGNSIGLRARVVGGGSLPASDQSVAYLEYGMPLRLPVSRLRTPGRVFGRVVEAGTGRGVANALVRLGPQVAITGKDGEVAFGGVPGGEHRLSMSQETSFADAVFVGDPTLIVDSTRTRPTTFVLSIARSARVEVAVRRFATVRTAVGSSADSLVDAGPLADASLVLASDRDTLYRTTNAAGKASFTDVPPGGWRVMVRGDAPAFHRFDPDRADLTLAPGESREISFRLVPRRREVQLIGDGQELRPTSADPKASTPQGVTRTRPPKDR